MSNHITIELCAEDRKRIDELIAFAGMIASEMKSKPNHMELAPDGTITVTHEEHPVDAVVPHELPEPVAEPEQPKYTKADILAKVQKLAQPNSPKRAEAKAIVQSYAAKVSDIPEDKYNEVMAKLAELEG